MINRILESQDGVEVNSTYEEYTNIQQANKRLRQPIGYCGLFFWEQG